MPGGGPIGGGGGAVPPVAPAPSDVEWATGAGDDGAPAPSAGEDRVRVLEAELARARAENAELKDALAAAERRGQIERELTQADAVDLETASLLTELAVSSMPEPDVSAAVRDLKKRKPFLFKGGGGRGSAMSGAVSAGPGAALGRAAEEARESGDRAALLRYLRMRRGA